MHDTHYPRTPAFKPLGGGLGAFGFGGGFQHRPMLPGIAFAPEGVGGGGDEGAGSQTFSAEYVRELRGENKGLRLKLRNYEDENPKLKQAAADADTRVADAVKAAQAEAQKGFNARIIASELKAAATAAGMLDLDGIRLMDTSKVSVGEDGSIKIPDGLFEGFKESKPYLFRPATGAETGTTTQTQQAPKPAPTTTKAVSAMSADEVSAFERANGITA